MATRTRGMICDNLHRVCPRGPIRRSAAGQHGLRPALERSRARHRRSRYAHEERVRATQRAGAVRATGETREGGDMSDPLFYPRRQSISIPRLDGPTAVCPSCSGNGWRETNVGQRRCVACRGIGIVEASRVCSDCKQWYDYCHCRRDQTWEGIPRKPGRPGRSR